jgi:hypothetical protein
MFEEYVAERQPGPKTIKKWRPALLSLIARLGHDDASLVTPDDIVAWKDALLRPVDDEAVRGVATVRDGYLGGAKAVFGWAKDNRKTATNPVTGIIVRVPRRICQPDSTVCCWDRIRSRVGVPCCGLSIRTLPYSTTAHQCGGSSGPKDCVMR